MSGGSVHWIDEARADYERRPWVAWALRLRVPLHLPLVTLHDAARAIADAAGKDALSVLVSIEVTEALRGSKGKQQHAILLLKLVSKSLIDTGRFDEKQVTESIVSSYRDHGIDVTQRQRAHAG